jgi:hypothetical protein
MKMIHLIILTIGVCLFAGCGRDPSESKTAPTRAATPASAARPVQDLQTYSDGFICFSNSTFAFDVPRSWPPMAANVLTKLGREVENQNREQYRQLYGKSEGYDWGVDGLTGYAPQASVALVVFLLKVPPESKGAIEAAWDRSNQVIEYGKRSGILKEVHNHERAVVNGLPALKSDFEMGDGDRMLSVVIEAAPGRIVQANFNCPQDLYPKFQANAERIMQSIVVPATNDGLSELEGTLHVLMAEQSGALMKMLKTANGEYEVRVSSNTVFRGIEATDAGVRWQLGEQYRIRGKITARVPTAEFSGEWHYIDARIVELIK